MLERVLGIILPVFLIIALGYAFARKAKPDMLWVNRINMNVLAPALIFSALSSKSFDVTGSGRLMLASAVKISAGASTFMLIRFTHSMSGFALRAKA